MAGLVLKGAPLRAVASLARFAPVRRLLWAVSAPDFGIGALRALPPSARMPLDDAPRPVAGRSPHVWEHGGHEVPAAKRTTVASLHAAFREGRTTPRAVLDAWIAAVEAGRFGEATFSPFVALDLDRARADADAATARHAAGAPLGPLDGVVVPVKDEVDLTGAPTLGGTRYRTAVATADGWSVRRLRAAVAS